MACFVLACGASSETPRSAPQAGSTPPSSPGDADPPRPSPSPGAAVAQGPDLSDLEAKCDAGDAAACRSVAGAYSNQDMHSALPFYRRACDLGDTESCTDWADLFERLERDDASPEELKQVLAVRQRACDAGDVWGCRAVALHYIEPDPSKRVVEPDEKRAFSLLMKGCLDGGGGPCIEPALILEGRSWCEVGRHNPTLCKEEPPETANLVAHDLDRALRLYKPLCHDDITHACVYTARVRRSALADVRFLPDHLAYAKSNCLGSPSKADNRQMQSLHCAISSTHDPSRAQTYKAAGCKARPKIATVREDKCRRPKSANERHWCWQAISAEELAAQLCDGS